MDTSPRSQALFNFDKLQGIVKGISKASYDSKIAPRKFAVNDHSMGDGHPEDVTRFLSEDFKEDF